MVQIILPLSLPRREAGSLPISIFSPFSCRGAETAPVKAKAKAKKAKAKANVKAKAEAKAKAKAKA